MARPIIAEYTDEEVRVKDSTRVWTPVNARQNVGAAYTGKYVCYAAIVTDNQLDEAGLDALETSINAIPEVFNSLILVGSSRIPRDRLPANTETEIYKLWVGLTAGFDMTVELANPPEPPQPPE